LKLTALCLSLWVLFGAGSDSGTTSSLERALSRIPDALSPGEFRLQVVAGHKRIQAAVETRTLFVSVDQLDAHPTVWLHELGHLASAGPRPEDPAARRVLVALEEGVADYYAAILADSPHVGDSHTVMRDLNQPPRVTAEAWAALALPGFDPHPFGWALAAALWRAEPNVGGLLVDLVHALRVGELRQVRGPRKLLDAVVHACPPRSRQTLDQILSAWLPSELRLEVTP
jgi:hypothetical protein